MHKIFISRDLAPESIFRQRLEAHGGIIYAQSLLTFSKVLLDELPAVDWLFFYSKNGVKYLLEQYPNKEKMPKVATIGEGTAMYLYENYSIKADWIGNGQPKEVAFDFEAIAKGKKVLFVQAQNSKQSVQKLLSNKIATQALVVYDNRIKTDFDLPEIDILVFTSPLNVQAYFDKYQYVQQKIVCIGRTTAQALQKYKINKYKIAAKPNEAALADACIELIKNLK